MTNRSVESIKQLCRGEGRVYQTTVLGRTPSSIVELTCSYRVQSSILCNCLSLNYHFHHRARSIRKISLAAGLKFVAWTRSLLLIYCHHTFPSLRMRWCEISEHI